MTKAYNGLVRNSRGLTPLTRQLYSCCSLTGSIKILCFPIFRIRIPDIPHRLLNRLISAFRYVNICCTHNRVKNNTAINIIPYNLFCFIFHFCFKIYTKIVILQSLFNSSIKNHQVQTAHRSCLFVKQVAVRCAHIFHRHQGA